VTKSIRISGSLSLPLDWITLATVVYGARGAGKTSFGRVVAEEAVKARQRFCAIDLKGDWFGLKSSADGKSDGIPVVIFGGEHADVPLEPDAGAFVGETVARLEQSCILDFELLSKGKQIRFLAEFFEALYHHNREPLLLLLDEAQRYAPQKPGPGEARTLGAVQDLVKLGRKHGIGPVLFTQRGAGLNKEVSELCDLLVAFRTPGPLDQERIRDWLDANTTKAQRDEVMGKLSGLPTGTAIFASGHPELKTFGVYPVRRPETFDSSATPKVGQRRAEPKTLAKPDLEVLRTKMAAAIERAKADDPRELRARIRTLESKLNGATFPMPEMKEVRVEVPMFDKTAFEELKREVAAQLTLARGNIDGLLHSYMSMCLQSSGARPGALIGKPRPAPLPESVQPRPPVTLKEKVARNKSPNGAGEPIGGGLRRMLIALAQRPQGLTNRQLGVRAGLSSRSGTFSTYLSRGRSQGWIDDHGERRAITPQGLIALGRFEPLPEGRDLLRYWLGELGGGASRMLEVLAGAYPRSLTNEALGQAADISRSGTFSTYLSKLRTLELVEGRGELRMSEELA
jgi:hypothetical protein